MCKSENSFVVFFLFFIPFWSFEITFSTKLCKNSKWIHFIKHCRFIDVAATTNATTFAQNSCKRIPRIRVCGSWKCALWPCVCTWMTSKLKMEYWVRSYYQTARHCLLVHSHRAFIYISDEYEEVLESTRLATEPRPGTTFRVATAQSAQQRAATSRPKTSTGRYLTGTVWALPFVCVCDDYIHFCLFDIGSPRDVGVTHRCRFIGESYGNWAAIWSA